MTPVESTTSPSSWASVPPFTNAFGRSIERPPTSPPDAASETATAVLLDVAPIVTAPLEAVSVAVDSAVTSAPLPMSASVAAALKFRPPIRWDVVVPCAVLEPSAATLIEPPLTEPSAAARTAPPMCALAAMIVAPISPVASPPMSAVAVFAKLWPASTVTAPVT